MGMDGPDKTILYVPHLPGKPMQQAPASFPVSFPNIYTVIKVYSINSYCSWCSEINTRVSFLNIGEINHMKLIIIPKVVAH